MITKAEWKRRQRIKRYTRMGVVVLLGIIILLTLIFGIKSLFSSGEDDTGAADTEVTAGTETADGSDKPDMQENLLTVNEYSRPGIKLAEVKGIIVHSTPDVGSSAAANRDYYEGLRDSGNKHESVHFIIGLEGEIIQCIPLDEISFSANSRNNDTISVECCYPESEGEFSDVTEASLIKLLSWLCSENELDKTDVLRHSDVSDSECPKYYTANGTEWENLLGKINVD